MLLDLVRRVRLGLKRNKSHCDDKAVYLSFRFMLTNIHEIPTLLKTAVDNSFVVEICV